MLLQLEQINDFIKSKHDMIYDMIQLEKDTDDIYDTIMKESLKIIKEESISDDLYNSRVVYIKEYIKKIFDEIINDYKLRIENKKDIIQKLEKLKKLDLPEQRTKEWYELRSRVITASSLADCIGEGHFSTKEDMLLDKCGALEKKDIPFDILEWGVRYEPVATKFYENLNNVKILEMGLVPHPTFKIFGASPDGICDENSPEEYIGRMLEIKCPPKREFTKEVPKHYWMQMQGQLEACNLEECDFLQVKFCEYITETSFIEDTYEKDGIINHTLSKNGYPKGLVIAFIQNNEELNPTIHYEYSEFGKTLNELKEWYNKTKSSYSQKYDICKKHWWRIERYECTLVARDRKWWLSVQPKLLDFWEDVEIHRKKGVQEILNKREEKKLKE